MNTSDAKKLLRAATQLSKVTGQTPEKSLVTIVKSIAQNMKVRNKG